MQYQQQQSMYSTSLQTPEQRQMGLFLHLSQLLIFVVPFGGIAVPIVLWQINKDKMPALDAHGKMVVNWMISSVIYFVVSLILSLVLVGIVGVAALVIMGIVMGIVFPIIGAIKANNGEFWEYPLTIKFLK
jgi:uncharacterized Tic20 family protein